MEARDGTLLIVEPADPAAGPWPVHSLDRVARSAFGTIAVGTVLEVRLKDQFEHELGGCLNHPIPKRRNAERRSSPPALGDARMERFGSTADQSYEISLSSPILSSTSPAEIDIDQVQTVR